MDSFKLANDTELSISNSSASTDSLTVTFTNVTDFDGFKANFTRKNLAEVSLYADGSLTGLYEGYTWLSPYSVDGENVTITFSKPGLLEQLRDMQARVTVLQGIIEALQDTNEELTTTVEVMLMTILPSLMGIE